jgi:CDP-diacylglycerol---glycerol-3-phosphate 3-phosphatidyltransferase
MSRENTTAAKLQILRKALASHITQPIITFLARSKITPNMVTWFGFVLILVASILAGLGHLFAAGWVVLLSGFLDIIDGALARKTNQVTRFGGVLDSSLDRLSEAAILIGIMSYFLFYSNSDIALWTALVIGAAMIFSFMVSYVRARAEGAGLDCQVGIFTRAERVVVLALGLLLSGIPLVLLAVILIITVLSMVTFIQRLLYVYQRTK